MYNNFKVFTKKDSIFGYHWPVKNPKQVICLVHGLGEYAGKYDDMCNIFNKNNIAVMGMDLKGHGCSSGVRGDLAPRMDILSHIDSLLKEADKSYPNVPKIILGYSIGGNICLDYRRRGVLRYMVSAYVITSPWISLKKEFPKPLIFTVSKVSKIIPQLKLDTKLKPVIVRKKKLKGVSAEQMHLYHNNITARAISEAQKVANELYANEGKDLIVKPKPILLMHGSEDSICNVEGSKKFAEYERDVCHFIVWPGYNHSLLSCELSEGGREIINTIVDWIKDIN